jgi:hypothetical protein
MAKSFEELSEMPLDAHKAPSPVPPGHYLVGIAAPAEEILSSQKQTPGFRVRFRFYQAREDVNMETLNKFLEEGNMKLSDVEMTQDFYITERSSFMFADFIKKALRLTSANFKQACADMAGHQLIIQVAQKSTQRPDGTMGLRSEVTGHAPAD